MTDIKTRLLRDPERESIHRRAQVAEGAIAAVIGLIDEWKPHLRDERLSAHDIIITSLKRDIEKAVSKARLSQPSTISALERRVEELESQLEHAHKGEDAAVEHGRTIRVAAISQCIAKAEDYALDARPDSEYALACRDLVEAFEDARRALSKGTGE